MSSKKKVLLNEEFSILSCHECYEHAKVLKFADRKKYYKNKLRELIQKFNVKVIDYLITDTQVFLLTSPDSIRILTGALRWIHAQFPVITIKEQTIAVYAGNHIMS